MIKLERTFTPIKLTPSFVNTKTLEFKTNGNNVWNVDWLKDALQELSFGKCAYCECDVKTETSYVEVEHFEDKNNNPDKVLEWENLLPSCKRCNGSKHSHDVLIEPIVNPFKDSPSSHLKFNLYRYVSIDSIGRTTIDVVDLNNPERAVCARFEVGELLHKSIENAAVRLESFEEKPIIQRKNKLKSLIESILLECQPDSSYSATCSTVLNSSEIFGDIISGMKKHGLWTEKFEDLMNNTKFLVL